MTVTQIPGVYDQSSAFWCGMAFGIVVMLVGFLVGRWLEGGY